MKFRLVNKMQKILKCTVIISLLLMTVACGGEEEAVETQAIVRPTDVAVIEVKKQDYQEVYVLPGVAEAWDVISIPTQAMGPVTWIGVVEGQSVKEGDVLMRVNTDTLKGNLDSALVQLNSSKSDMDRTVNLFKAQAVSQKTHDDAVNAHELARVSHSLAQTEYDKGEIKSPVDGIVDSVTPKMGEYIQTGTSIATVVQLDTLKIYLDIPEYDIPYLSLGQKVEIQLADATNTSNTVVIGEISYISVTSNTSTLTYSARIDIPGNMGIRPGQIVRARIVKQDFKDAIAVELYSVIDKDGTKIVYLDNNSVAEERIINVGTMFNDMIIVESGLSEGDRVVNYGQHFLRDTAPINVVE